ncbi:MAG TPA: septum formation initiator family protein [Actinomycetota bacterium]|jgi:cell division protein FtsB|nr:septum formation initiator family protein [Actinomycetota bacterium]
MAPPKHLKARFRMGAFGLVVGALALTGVAPARQAFQQREQLAQVEAKVSALQERNDELTGRLNRLSDIAYMEKLAREQLGLIRPGETAYVVVPAPAPLKPVSDVEPEPQGIRQRTAEWIKDLIGNE